jgi:galactoside O-acetyltransferase
MKKSSYYTNEELAGIGFRSLGENVLVSRMAAIYMPETISMGSNVRVDDFCVFTGGVEIRIGSFVHIANGCYLYGNSGGIVLEDFSGLSARVTVYGEGDDYSGDAMTNPTIPLKYRKQKTGRVTLGRHAVVGVNTTILAGVTLGEGCAVGAHSLVTRDCMPWKVYVGVPARAIKERSRRILEIEKAFALEMFASK